MEMTIDQTLSKALESQLKGDLAQAEMLYAAILENNSLHPEANFRMGLLALQLGKTANAPPYFIKAIDSAPERIDFWIAYMNYLTNSDQERDASLLLEKARQSALRATDILRLEQINLRQSQGADINEADRVEGLKQLIELYQNGDLNNLVNKAIDYIKTYPDQFQAHNVMGAAFSALNKYDEAISSFEQAVKIKSDYSEGYNNLGLAYRGKGKLLLAVEALRSSITHNQDYFVGYNNLGATLISLKEFEEALTNLNRAVELEPQYAEAHNNRGIALASLEREKESEASFRRALEINPNYSEAHNNLGKKFFNENSIEKAIESFEKAVLISPRYADAYTNLGKCYGIQGDLDKAIEMFDHAIDLAKDFPDPYLARSDAYLRRNRNDDSVAIEDLEKAISLDPLNLKAYHQLCAVHFDRNRNREAISVAVRGLEFSPSDAKLNRYLGFCLAFKTLNDPYESLLKAVDNFLDMRGLFRPNMIAPAVISCVKANKEFMSCLEKIKNDVFIDFDTLISSLVGVKPLMKLLCLCPLPDLDIEKLLKKARLGILTNRETLTSSEKLTEFLLAQATQCFLNEYVYEETENEKDLILVLEQKIAEKLKMKETPSAIDFLCLASYRPLHQYKWAKLIKKNVELEKIIKLQIEDIEREKKLLENLEMLAPYQNEVSIKVQSQYEENPYPRWVNLYEEEKPLTIKENLDINQSRYKQTKPLMSEGKKEILIAGCGTGRHPIEKALAYKNSQVLAVDLSSASLGYALRKTEELGITNINYLQADILDLKKLGRQFDLIESAGVLHHMQDPMEGWHVLTEVLKPGGIMMIGLYSEIARKKIVELRQEIKKRGINNHVESIKRYRQELIEGSGKGYVSELWGDFFSTSEIRDLLFHVQEHRFTIPRIKRSLEELGLEFSGFRIRDSLMNLFKDFYGDEVDTFDLGLWDEFETKHPDTFAGMYQFWCQRVES